MSQVGYGGLVKATCKCKSEAKRSCSVGMAYILQESVAFQGHQLQFRSAYINNCQKLVERIRRRITLDMLLCTFSLGKRYCHSHRQDSGLTRPLVGGGSVIFTLWNLLEKAGELACDS